MDASGGNKVKLWQKSLGLDPAPPPGACELIVYVWLLYHHPNFKYCTLLISGTDKRTDRWTDEQTDDPNARCPRRTFQAGGIKRSNFFART